MPLLNAYNRNLSDQVHVLTTIIARNKVVHDVILRAQDFKIDNYYIGAGCIAQTVWNYLCEFPLDYGIKDIDFAYFNDSDVSEEAEDKNIELINNHFCNLPIKLDIKNQARVHLWYKDHFGYEIKPYPSLEDAINTWPTTSTAIGIRKQDDQWHVYAPYGLNDLFGMIVRANKIQITQQIYEKKIESWTRIWTKLQVIPWA
ncbi:nucleotidyltransferase family protein [Cohnella cellulosilytica]